MGRLFFGRGCLMVIVVLSLGCLALCAGLYLVGLPRLRDAVREPVEEVIGTEIARQIALVPGEAPVPGTYTLDEAQLNQTLGEQADRYEGIDDLTVDISPSGISIDLDLSGQDTTYTGDVTVIDGRLDVIDMESDGGFAQIIPAGDMAEILEDQINGYLELNGLRVASVELGEGTLTIETEPAR